MSKPHPEKYLAKLTVQLQNYREHRQNIVVWLRATAAEIEQTREEDFPDNYVRKFSCLDYKE